PYFMTSVANAALEADVILAFAKHKLGASKLAILYGTDDFGSGVRDVAKTIWTKGGGTIVAEEGIEPAKADLAAVATKLMASKPDVIYVVLAGVAIGTSVKQIREAGFTQPLLGQQGFEAPELFSVAGSAANNSYWTSAATTVAKDKDEAFVAAYKAAFN